MSKKESMDKKEFNINDAVENVADLAHDVELSLTKLLAGINVIRDKGDDMDVLLGDILAMHTMEMAKGFNNIAKFIKSHTNVDINIKMLMQYAIEHFPDNPNIQKFKELFGDNYKEILNEKE